MQQPKERDSIDRPSSRNIVLDTIYTLFEHEVDVTVETIARYTGLKIVTVNDCIKDLKEREEIYSIERGVYRPKVRNAPARAVSITPMPLGTVKVEVGDVVLDLVPREVQLLAPFFAGYLHQVAASAYTHNSMMMAERIAKSERKIKALEAKKASEVRQPALVFEDVTPKEKDERQTELDV